MKIVIGSDHAGFELKQHLIPVIQELGHEVLDVGADSTAAVDYPDFAAKVGHAILDGKADRGVLICGSGVGASAAENKMHGIRGGICHDTYSAHQGVEHDDMNVLGWVRASSERRWLRIWCGRTFRRSLPTKNGMYED